jgi:hypothetical protein
MERQNWGTKSQTLACKFLSAMNKAASRLFAGALCGRRHRWTGRFVLYSKSQKWVNFAVSKDDLMHI